MDGSTRIQELIGEPRGYDARIVGRAKLKCRSDIALLDWDVRGYRGDRTCLEEPEEHGGIARVHTDNLSVEEFYQKFEIPGVPLCIDGIVQQWPAWTNWSLKSLHRRYRHVKFRVGDDDDGYAVRIKMKYFLRYMMSQTDDSPLYIFDSRFIKLDGSRILIGDYEVPKYFREDLFHLMGEHRRPPYRWFLVGPKRSGSGVHIDPLGTSAWNALISGRKRWILFPPNVPKKIVKAKNLKRIGEDDEPVDYFTNILPRLKRSMGDTLDYIEFVQYPGETVFIPGGWWHAVLNLDDTIAVTQNFVSSNNFRNCWYQTRKGRRGMARKWYRELKRSHPHLAKVADEMNRIHGYDMEKERERHHEDYRRQVFARRVKVGVDKYRRRLNGVDMEKSSSSSGDATDSDWTSLSENFDGLNSDEENQVGMAIRQVLVHPPQQQMDQYTPAQNGTTDNHVRDESYRTEDPPAAHGVSELG
eukprot:CAMPEP_0113955772 /NCGR_PEP_ID=MMETSP0011_2-20120614/1591_1 /TAXON_ID=101924 /ORGANISM="Rhodosorus marinus" /LENGTH=470 /DNA_ID=CAMNT_0000965643 /DNA_START=163 /DNA_END=1575 /DNA_ORIENTATION=- /assembly_acc=CAM_ASM_000156